MIYRVEYWDGAMWRLWSSVLYEPMAQQIAARCRRDPWLRNTYRPLRLRVVSHQ